MTEFDSVNFATKLSILSEVAFNATKSKNYSIETLRRAQDIGFVTKFSASLDTSSRLENFDKALYNFFRHIRDCDKSSFLNFSRDGSENPCRNRLIIFFHNHYGVIIESDVAAVISSYVISLPHDHRPHNIFLLNFLTHMGRFCALNRRNNDFSHSRISFSAPA